MRIYEICQIGSSSSHWLRSGFIQRQGASQVYVELRFTMMECSSTSTHHRSCKETFNLYYYQADSNEATPTYPPWMENPYTKVRPHPLTDAVDESQMLIVAGNTVIISMRLLCLCGCFFSQTFKWTYILYINIS